MQINEKLESRNNEAHQTRVQTMATQMVSISSYLLLLPFSPSSSPMLMFQAFQSCTSSQPSELVQHPTNPPKKKEKEKKKKKKRNTTSQKHQRKKKGE